MNKVIKASLLVAAVLLVVGCASKKEVVPSDNSQIQAAPAKSEGKTHSCKFDKLGCTTKQSAK